MVLASASASIFDCNKVSALVRLVISVAMEAFKPETSKTLAALSVSIFDCKVESALVLFEISLFKSVLNKSVVAVNEFY